MSKLIFVVGLVSSMLAMPCRATGGVVITDQSRSVHIDGSFSIPQNPSFNQTVDALPFVAFDQPLENSATDSTGKVSVTSRARQTSTLQSTGEIMTFISTGTTSGDAGTNPVGPGSASGNGSSLFSILFTLDTPATYQLDLDASAAGPNGSTTHLGLGGATLVLDSVVLAGSLTGTSAGRTSNHLSQSGALAPGDYAFTGGVQGGGAPNSWGGGYSVEFRVVSAVPLPAAGWAGLITILGVVVLRRLKCGPSSN